MHRPIPDRHLFLILSMAVSLSSKRLSSLSCISHANSNPISKRRRHKHGRQLRKMSGRVGRDRMAKDLGSSGRPIPLRRSSPSILRGSSSQPQPRTPQSRGPLMFIRLHPPDCTASRLRTQSFLSSNRLALGPRRHFLGALLRTLLGSWPHMHIIPDHRL